MCEETRFFKMIQKPLLYERQRGLDSGVLKISKPLSSTPRHTYQQISVKSFYGYQLSSLTMQVLHYSFQS